MNGTNSATNSDWVRLKVGGKPFETTKDTLTSRYPESFLARLVNGVLPSEKDESGAYLIDGHPEHFDTILTYLRRGILNLDGNEKTTKDLLGEADFYNIQPLVDEIQKALRPAKIRPEIVFLYVHYHVGTKDNCEIICSEKQDDYEVLLALRDKFNDIQGTDGRYGFSMDEIRGTTRIEIEVVLRNFGFDEKSLNSNNEAGDGNRTSHWKFVRTVSK